MFLLNFGKRSCNPGTGFFLVAFACIQVFSQSAGNISANLDIPASDMMLFETLRRSQTRSASIYFSQNYPQRSQAMEQAWQSDAFLTAYDKNFLARSFPFGRRPLVQFTDTARNNSFYLSPLAFTGFERELNNDTSSLLGGAGLRVFGSVKTGLSYYSRGHVFSEKSSEKKYGHQFNPDFGETCSAEKGAGDSLLDTRTCARFEHYLLIDLPWLMLKAGRDNLHMGPGYFSSLMAQRQTPPYYLIEGRIDFADWFFLDNYFLKMTDTDHQIRKYQHIHRFEFRPLSSLSIAFQDAVIYQEKDADLKYVLPLSPLAFSEDNSGGDDNDAMQFDFLYTGIRNFSVWGEVFIDDLLGPGAFFDDFWENRWAALAGFQITSPWEAADADLVVEYSRVEPWTYTGRLRYTSFRHYNVPSASKLGPDSRSIDIQLSYRPLPFIQLRERVEFNDKGTRRGSGLQDIHGKSDPVKKEFLGGDVNSVRVLTHSLAAFWNQYVSGELSVVQEFGEGDVFRMAGDVYLEW